MQKRGNPGVTRGYLLPGLPAVRAEKGISRAKLAEKSGVNYTTLWRLESGRFGASAQTIVLIASALGVNESALKDGVRSAA
jgi:transcriptional regulator with XRE-family HTH domain